MYIDGEGSREEEAWTEKNERQRERERDKDAECDKLKARPSGWRGRRVGHLATALQGALTMAELVSP